MLLLNVRRSTGEKTGIYLQTLVTLWNTFPCLLSASSGGLAGRTTDTQAITTVCQGEFFKGFCGSDDVLVMTNASYGRIRISRCVKENFGYVGCSHDVMDIMDSLCSGRHECTLRVLEENFPNVKSCHEDLKSYLEVSYKCLQVVSKPRHICKAMQPVYLTDSAGYLASIISKETGCGTADSPWVIDMLPGQKVNITLIDFGTWASNNSYNPSPSVDGFSRLCRVYATIRESQGSRSVTVCGGENRHRPVYISQLHRVEVRIISTNTANKPPNFLLHYQVTGCPDVQPPAGAWVKRNERLAVFGCTESQVTWEQTCENTNWVGDVKNCTVAPVKEAYPEQFSLTSLPLGVSILIVVVLALVIGLVILAIGIFCLHRNRADDEHDEDNPYMDTRDIMLSERIYEHAQGEPKHTIVCAMHNAQTSTLVARMTDKECKENDYAASRQHFVDSESCYNNQNGFNRVSETFQSGDILHTPNFLVTNAHLCGKQVYDFPRPSSDIAHAHYCAESDVHETETVKRLGIGADVKATCDCDASKDSFVKLPCTDSALTHCNKCGLKTFGGYSVSHRIRDNNVKNINESQGGQRNNLNSL